MSKTARCLCLVTLFFSAWSADAAESCEKANTIKQLIDCGEVLSPQLNEIEKQILLKQLEFEKNRIWQNPEFSFQKDSRGDTEASLLFPVDINGGRSSKTRIAEHELRSHRVERDLVSQNIKKESILKLLRLKQIEIEKKFLWESINSFKGLIEMYSQRKVLSPDQDVALFTFNVVLNQYRYKYQNYEYELSEIMQYFETETRQNIADVKKIITDQEIKWPKIAEEEKDLSTVQQVVLANLNREIAQEQLNLSSKEYWSTLKIGPYFKGSEKDSDQNGVMGIAFTFDLPVFNRNQRDSIYLKEKIKKEDITFSNTLLAINKSRKKYKEQYDNFIALNEKR